MTAAVIKVNARIYNSWGRSGHSPSASKTIFSMLELNTGVKEVVVSYVEGELVTHRSFLDGSRLHIRFERTLVPSEPRAGGRWPDSVPDVERWEFVGNDDVVTLLSERASASTFTLTASSRVVVVRGPTEEELAWFTLLLLRG